MAFKNTDQDQLGRAAKRKPWFQNAKYLSCTLGSIAVSVATGAPVLMGAVGIASDYAVYTMKKSALQAAADAAALAATRELSVIASGTAPPAAAPIAMKSMSMAMASDAAPTGGPIEEIRPPAQGPRRGDNGISHVAGCVGCRE